MQPAADLFAHDLTPDAVLAALPVGEANRPTRVLSEAPETVPCSVPPPPATGARTATLAS